MRFFLVIIYVVLIVGCSGETQREQLREHKLKKAIEKENLLKNQKLKSDYIELYTTKNPEKIGEEVFITIKNVCCLNSEDVTHVNAISDLKTKLIIMDKYDCTFFYREDKHVISNKKKGYFATKTMFGLRWCGDQYAKVKVYNEK